MASRIWKHSLVAVLVPALASLSAGCAVRSGAGSYGNGSTTPNPPVTSAPAPAQRRVVRAAPAAAEPASPVIVATPAPAPSSPSAAPVRAQPAPPDPFVQPVALPPPARRVQPVPVMAAPAAAEPSPRRVGQEPPGQQRAEEVHERNRERKRIHEEAKEAVKPEKAKDNAGDQKHKGNGIARGRNKV